MNSNSITVTLNGREFKLIGTAHVSRESCEEVKRIIHEEKPDMVCVELDQGRFDAITKNDHWEKMDLTKVFKEGKGFLLIANLVLASFQRRLGNEMGVKPGEEMKVAIETAQEQGLQYSLCDREVHTTLRRAWARCGFLSKSKLLASLLASAFTKEKLSEQEIEDLKNKNELDGMMNELAEYLPGVKATVIDERDRYLAAKIWTSTPPEENKKIAAVIGAGHLQGIKTHLEKMAGGEENADVSELEKIPKRGILLKAIGFIIPALVIALVAAGFYFTGMEEGIALILRWVFLNGTFAAIGALAAFGHPLTIIASFLAAPITSITPVIGVGMFSGLVQVMFHKPRVTDIQDITQDTTSLKGWYRNRVTRALLVFFLSTLGSAIATFTWFIAGFASK